MNSSTISPEEVPDLHVAHIGRVICSILTVLRLKRSPWSPSSSVCVVSTFNFGCQFVLRPIIIPLQFNLGLYGNILFRILIVHAQLEDDAHMISLRLSEYFLPAPKF